MAERSVQFSIHMQKVGGTAQQLSSGRDAKSSHNLLLSHQEKGKYTNCFLIYNNLQCVSYFSLLPPLKISIFGYLESCPCLCTSTISSYGEDRISFVFACFPTNLLQFPLISCPISGFASLLDRLFLLYMKKVYLLFVLTCPYITGLNSWYRLSTSWQTNWLTVTVRADCFIYFAFSLPVIFITFSYSYSAACNTTTSSFSRLLTVILPL